MDNPQYDAQRVNWTKFEAYSARASSRKLAAALDRTVERFGIIHGRTD